MHNNTVTAWLPNNTTTTLPAKIEWNSLENITTTLPSLAKNTLSTTSRAIIDSSISTNASLTISNQTLGTFNRNVTRLMTTLSTRMLKETTSGSNRTLRDVLTNSTTNSSFLFNNVTNLTQIEEPFEVPPLTGEIPIYVKIIIFSIILVLYIFVVLLRITKIM